MPIDILNYIWQELQHGNISVIFNLSERSVINEQALRILNVDPSHMTADDIAILDLLVKICNIVYKESSCLTGKFIPNTFLKCFSCKVIGRNISKVFSDN